MRERGSDGDRTDERSESTDVHRNAWQRTLEDMNALAADHEAAGRTVVRVIADDTAPEHPDVGDSDRYGLVHVVPRNHATELASAVESAEFPVYDVYRATVEGRVFLVTELVDPDAEVVVLIAATYRQQRAEALRTTATETGVTYTHVQKVDGTPVTSFTHEDPEKFFPE